MVFVQVDNNVLEISTIVVLESQVNVENTSTFQVLMDRLNVTPMLRTTYIIRLELWDTGRLWRLHTRGWEALGLPISQISHAFMSGRITSWNNGASSNSQRTGLKSLRKSTHVEGVVR